MLSDIYHFQLCMVNGTVNFISGLPSTVDEVFCSQSSVNIMLKGEVTHKKIKIFFTLFFYV